MSPSGDGNPRPPCRYHRDMDSTKSETTMKYELSKSNRSPRRSKFLSSVAAIGLVAAIAGGGIYQNVNVLGLTGPAHAAEAVQAAHPGFADLVEKVKPSVVSVRVKMEAAARQTSMDSDE